MSKQTPEERATKQVKIVLERLQYHFVSPSGEWNTPHDLPFMNEFLNEVVTLTTETKQTSSLLSRYREALEELVEVEYLMYFPPSDKECEYINNALSKAKQLLKEK